MKLLFDIVAAVLATLGVFALLNGWAEKAKAPQRWTKLKQERRSFLALLASLAGGLVIGSWRWYRTGKTKEDLHLLFELEVLLAQLEGLVNAAIAQGSTTNALQPIKLLVSKVGEYGFKASRLFSDLEQRLSTQDYEDLKQGAMAITVGVDILETSKAVNPTTDTITEALINMQTGIRLARAKTRELIDERTSAS